MTTFEFVANCVGLFEYDLEICDQWEENFKLDEADISDFDLEDAKRIIDKYLGKEEADD